MPRGAAVIVDVFLRKLKEKGGARLKFVVKPLSIKITQFCLFFILVYLL